MDISDRLAEREALRKAAADLQHRMPTGNEDIERRISEQVTAEALARKLQRDAKKKAQTGP